MSEVEAPTRVIVIEDRGPGDITVRVGDRYQDRLGWDECLGLIAVLITPKVAGGYCVLKTKEEHEAREVWRARRLEAWQKQLGPVSS